ncbi:MAG: hypothetical protein QOI78_663 [Actinomycetota bacterium]|nr:hypothetical protein [Actinomycetota bacterium]
MDGTHTLTASGRALDVPAHSTTAGTPLVTWTPNGGPNQKWVFTCQADGSYRVANAESGLCLDVADGSKTAGAKVIRWTCTDGANQRWLVGPGYPLKAQRSGLVLTTASTVDGSAVTRQADTGTALQRWALG